MLVYEYTRTQIGLMQEPGPYDINYPRVVGTRDTNEQINSIFPQSMWHHTYYQYAQEVTVCMQQNLPTNYYLLVFHALAHYSLLRVTPRRLTGPRNSMLISTLLA